MAKSLIQINTDFDALPGVDYTSNVSFADVIGNKQDASNTTAGQASVIGLLRALLGITGTTTGVDITAIKAIIDLLPDAGALTSIAKEATLGTWSDTYSSNTILGILQTIYTGIGDYIYTPTAFSYLDTGGEQIIYTENQIDSGLNTIEYYRSIMVDMSNIVNNGTFKFYIKIDGVNFVEFSQYGRSFTKGVDSDGQSFELPVFNGEWKFTYTEDSDEGADKDIYYRLTSNYRQLY